MGEPTTTDPREALPNLELLTAGSTFARYEIVRCIGVGGMGAVFEATHALLRKRVALKAMHASLGRSEASRARFLREAETVARIRHPNVVDISDVGIERGIPFLVMEYLEGEDLSRLLAREGKLSPTRLADLLLPIVAGLCAVHRLGIVHRDIKPENIFFASDPLGGVLPKLVDFGVSKDLEASSGAAPPMRHTVAGTPYYMAPEQARGSAVLDGRADQYAMGVVMYQCLSLQRPFESESLLELVHRIDSGEYVPLKERCPELPDALCALVQKAMARRVEDRYPSTEAFGQALSEFASEAVATACARDFAAERRSAPSARAWSPEHLARLNAETLPSDPLLGVQAPAPKDSAQQAARPASGVRARDTEPSSVAEDPTARSRRAFLRAAFATAVVLLALFAWYLARSTAPQTAASHEAQTLREAPKSDVLQGGAPEPQAEEAAPHLPEPEVQAPEAPARSEEVPPPLRRAEPRPVKTKRESPSKPKHVEPVDIQLSR